MPPDTLRLRETALWSWSLYPNQCYLGRMQLTLRRPLEQSLAHLTDQEWQELHRTLSSYEGLLQDHFQPDRFNYKQLGNQWHQLHVHVVPRYADSRVWRGMEFVDHRFGDDPHPEFESPLNDEGTHALATWLRPLVSALDVT
ncbi:MAG: hypothetical protein AAGC70_11925 [Pseudomonadota bacterium]